ncbi:TPA: hypothetical protein NVH30_002915 [Vibrio cholerae]|nr:hypothetical protein [Vibrio cholerae]HCJ7280564.1 hypothetical protein [Vibrio cholerae]HCJ7318218.1 hypothetical protein [Vibrio cholerae]
MKYILILFSIALSASSAAVTIDDSVANKSDTLVRLPASTVPCYGIKPGMCEQDGKQVTHIEFVSNVAGEPSIVKAIHYFPNRDDKIILEYTTLEMEYIQEKSKEISRATIDIWRAAPFSSFLGFNTKRMSYLEKKQTEVQENCPKQGGCKILLELIEDLKNGVFEIM